MKPAVQVNGSVVATPSDLPAMRVDRGPRNSRVQTALKSRITVLILTRNEARNIARTLDRLQWAERIVVLDSFSTDDTREQAAAYGNVELFQRRFDTHSRQWNHGLDRIESEWVLALDADYELSGSFLSEIESLPSDPGVDAYYVRFKYRIGGRPLRSSLYPPRAVLFRRSQCRYEQDGHTQVLRIDGSVGWLESPIYHDDRKPLSEWLAAQHRYALLEAEHLVGRRNWTLRWGDRLRLWIVPAPVAVFVYTLLVKGLIFDGWPGWYYVLQRTLAEVVLSLRLIELRLVDNSTERSSSRASRS